MRRIIILTCLVFLELIYKYHNRLHLFSDFLHDSGTYIYPSLP